MSDKFLPELLQRPHLIGIGGAGMSAISRILAARGAQVSGSDLKIISLLNDLQNLGIKIFNQQSEKNFDSIPLPSCVIVSLAAIPDNNPELQFAKQNQIPIFSRSQILNILMEGNKKILIAGTHGKTSTTSMAVSVLQANNIDLSFAIGGQLNESGTNAHHGNDDIFVAEIDESDGSLLQYQPDIAVITNIEADHIDYFKSETNYHSLFIEFLDRFSSNGILICCISDKGVRNLLNTSKDIIFAKNITVFGYGIGELKQFIDIAPMLDVYVQIIDDSLNQNLNSKLSLKAINETNFQIANQARLKVHYLTVPTGSKNKILDYKISLKVLGSHMLLNATAAFLVSLALRLSPDISLTGLAHYTGVQRRLELKTVINNIVLFDDYAHHPTEVVASLVALKKIANFNQGKLIVVFQPHLYSRTKYYAKDFAYALRLADKLLLLPIYGSRELPVPDVTSSIISQYLLEDLTIAEDGSNMSAVDIFIEPDLNQIASLVTDLSDSGDVIVTLGAGDVTMLIPEISRALAMKYKI